MSESRKYLEDLRVLNNALEHNKLVPFVGAGVSYDSGVPLWNDIIKKFCEHLGLDSKNQDYLKIPQYYYNNRGFKEYKDLLNDIFLSNTYTPNELHKSIVDLGTDLIITTNYDKLLEATFVERGKFVDVICEDKDFTYSMNSKKLIKMHGDLDRDNIVLKEDDYINYSQNFCLIENFLKSIIGSHTLLFIGYSLSDYNVKQIFSWVKMILKEDFQNAYFLYSEGIARDYEKEYYKNIGVNIIELDRLEIGDIKFSELRSRSEKIKTFLDYIKGNDEIDVVSPIKNKIIGYDQLKYWNMELINRLFISFGYSLDDIGRLNLSNIEDLESSVNDKERQNNYTDEINNVLGNVGWYNSRIENKIYSYIRTFDYGGINDLISSYKVELTDNEPIKYIELGYMHYLMNDYIEAYRCMTRASKLFFSQYNYIWYIISEINRLNIYSILKSDFWNKFRIENQLSIIELECNLIDIDALIHDLPTRLKQVGSLLNDIANFQFYYRSFQQEKKINDSVVDEANNTYIFYCGIPSFMKYSAVIEDKHKFDSCNYLMVDRFKENRESYIYYAQALLMGINQKSTLKNDEKEQITIVRPEVLTNFDIFILVKYMPTKLLHKQLSVFSYKSIKVKDENYINTVIANLSEYNFDETYIINLFTLLVYCDIDFNILATLLDRLNQLDIDVEQKLEVRNAFIVFTNRFTDLDIESIDEPSYNIILSFIELLIDYISKKGISNSKGLLMINILVAIIKKLKNSKFYNEDIIFEYLSERKILLVLLELFDIWSKDYRDKIALLESKWIWDKKSIDNILIYGALLKNGLRCIDQKIENEICEIVNEINKKELKSFYMIEPKLCLLDLLMDGRIVDIDKVKDTLYNCNDKYIQWCIEPESFNYDEFNISWIKDCGTVYLKKILQNKKINRLIKNSLQNELSIGDIDSSILRVYFSCLDSENNIDV